MPSRIFRTLVAIVGTVPAFSAAIAQQTFIGEDGYTYTESLPLPEATQDTLVIGEPADVTFRTEAVDFSWGSPRLQVFDPSRGSEGRWVNLTRFFVDEDLTDEVSVYYFRGVRLADDGAVTNLQPLNRKGAPGRKLVSLPTPSLLRLYGGVDAQDICHVSPAFQFDQLSRYTGEDTGYTVTYAAESTLVESDWEFDGSTPFASTLQIQRIFDDLSGLTINELTTEIGDYLALLGESLTETARTEQQFGDNLWLLVSWIDPVSLTQFDSAFIDDSGRRFQVVTFAGADPAGFEQVLTSFSTQGAGQ